MGWKSLVSVFVVSSLVVTGYCYSDVIFRFFSGIFRGAPKPSGDGVSALATASEEAKALCAASQQRLASSSVPAICSSPEQALVPAIQNVDSITQVAGCVTTSNSEAVLGKTIPVVFNEIIISQSSIQGDYSQLLAAFQHSAAQDILLSAGYDPATLHLLPRSVITLPNGDVVQLVINAKKHNVILFQGSTFLSPQTVLSYGGAEAFTNFLDPRSHLE